MIKFQVSLIYIVNPSQPGGQHSKKLPLNKQSGRTRNHQKSTIVAGRSYIPFANSLQTLHGHVTLQVFTSRNIFFQSPSIQLSGRQAPPGGRQGILYYNFPFWDPRFSLPLCRKLGQVKISVSYVLCQFLTNSRKIIVSLFFSTKLKHFQF